MPIPTTSQTSYACNLRDSPLSEQAPTTHFSLVKSTLNLQSHPEGGYFVETDRDTLKVPNPFHGSPIYPNATVTDDTNNTDIDTTPTRTASTTIHYYLDPTSPAGVFHRNKARTVHTLHWGRGVYIVIHADEVDTNTNNENSWTKPPTTPKKARIETFIVGPDIAAGEKLQWIVEGGKFKASFLIPDPNSKESERGLLISETVVPGFEFMDHDFLTVEQLRELVLEEEVEELMWLVKK